MSSPAAGGRPLRVAAVIDSLGVGGVETGCLELLRSLDPRRFTPFLWAFRPGGLAAQVTAAGIPLTLGHDRPAEDPGWDARDAAARDAWTATLARELAAARIDVVLVYGWPEAVTAAQAAGIRAIVERCDGPMLAGRVPDKSALTAVICESRHARDILRVQRTRLGLDPRRCRVIRNGVDLERFRRTPGDRSRARASLGLPDDAFVVGCVARQAPEKNLALLVAAFARLVERTPDARSPLRLVLAGPDGGERAALATAITTAGLGDRVLLLDAVGDPERILAALDVFAFPSWIEGSPFAVLEAMAMGLPIVATPVGALPELLDDNAIVVDPLAPLATMRALQLLHGDPGLRSAMGDRSRELARHSSLRRMVAGYERVLEAAVRDATR
ncbi:MAG: glycosyltransferase [Chloroflexota bacterium]